MGILLRIASKLLHWIRNHSASCPVALKEIFSKKGGMICTNIYPPKKMSVNNVFLSSEKQDLSDFLSQWYLKYKQTKTKNPQ